MFIYDSMTQGLELLARRELESAESLFLNVINDPYSQPEETKRARTFLDDIRACAALGNAGINGVITGRALYDGRLDLAEALGVIAEMQEG